MSDLFWISDAQMARLGPFFPKSHGKPRVDDRRVLSGIFFINHNGLQWRKAPAAYGSQKTLYNRWKRLCDKGISTKTMLKRVKEKLDLRPERLSADTACGTGPLLGWLVDRKIAPHIPVFDTAGRSDGTWSRADFEWDAENDQYICPEGRSLRQFRRNDPDPNRGPTGKGTARYRALKEVCQVCTSTPRFCPNADARKITREEHEDARQVARDIAKTRQNDRSMKLRK